MPSKKRRRRLDKEESQIVIVGSGLAGLSAAISLEQAGFSNISIYERDDNFERQKEGYGLTLTYNPKGPLASLGLLEKVASEDCPSRSHYLFRNDGSILGYFGNAFSRNRGLGQRGNLRVPRKKLRKILFERLSTTKVYWGHTLMNYKWNSDSNQYTIKFHNISSLDTAVVTTDILVAADGVRSATLRQLYSPQRIENNVYPGLRSIGIRLILGIAEFTHPLLQERGFYTLDGKHRLFTMPYEANRFDKTEKNRIMWQLSFFTGQDVYSDPRAPLDSSLLRNYVLTTVKKWHAPVSAMVESTPLNKIWGTDLMDRDPKEVHSLIKEKQVKHLVVLGDALHSMSPFKGQGANQALADGPLLAHWLQRASINSAVTSFWREIVQRTAPVVQASRLAARAFHIPEVMNRKHSFSSIRPESVPRFLAKLEEENIGANLGPKLDERVAEMIKSSNVAAVECDPLIGEEEQQKALEFAAAGDVQGLRHLSLIKHSESIRSARDKHSRSCLHLAAKGGHTLACKWLLMELDCDATLTDKTIKNPVDYAANATTLSIFKNC